MTQAANPCLSPSFSFLSPRCLVISCSCSFFPLAKAPLWEFPSRWLSLLTSHWLHFLASPVGTGSPPLPASTISHLDYCNGLLAPPSPVSISVNTAESVSPIVSPSAPWLLVSGRGKAEVLLWDLPQKFSLTATFAPSSPSVSSHPSFIQRHSAPHHDCVCTCSMLHLWPETPFLRDPQAHPSPPSSPCLKVIFLVWSSGQVT